MNKIKTLIIGAIIILGLSVPAMASNRVQIVQQRVENVIVKQKTVEFDARYFLGLDGYYAVRDRIVEQAKHEELDDLKREHAELKARLDVLLELLSRQNGGGAVKPEPQPEPQPQPTEPEPTGSGEDSASPTERDKAVYALFKSNCAKCHNENKKSGGIQLVNSANVALLDQPLENRVLIYDVTRGVNLDERGRKRMPLNGTALPDDSVELLYQWMVDKANSSE